MCYIVLLILVSLCWNRFRTCYVCSALFCAQPAYFCVACCLTRYVALCDSIMYLNSNICVTCYVLCWFDCDKRMLVVIIVYACWFSCCFVACLHATLCFVWYLALSYALALELVTSCYNSRPRVTICTLTLEYVTLRSNLQTYVTIHVLPFMALQFTPLRYNSHPRITFHMLTQFASLRFTFVYLNSFHALCYLFYILCDISSSLFSQFVQIFLVIKLDEKRH